MHKSENKMQTISFIKPYLFLGILILGYSKSYGQKTIFGFKSTGDKTSQNDSELFNTNIVFSNQPIPEYIPKESVSTFDETDHIYALAKFPKSIKETMGWSQPYSDGSYNLNLNLSYNLLNSDMKSNHFIRIDLTETEASRDFLVLDILPAANHATTLFSDYMSPFPIEIQDLKQGKYQMTISLFGDSNQLLINGHFLIVVSGTYGNSMEKERMEVIKHLKIIQHQKTQLPDEFYNTNPAPTAPELSIDNLTQIFEKQMNAKVKKLVYGYSRGSDYGIQKDSFGNVERKYVNREVWIAFEYNDDGKCYYMNCGFGMKYLGDGKYGKLLVSDASTSSRYWTEISCLNIK